MKNIDLYQASKSNQRSMLLELEKIISFQTDISQSIQQAMKDYIEEHPSWDQYSFLQAALAGFLIQNVFSPRLITRLYIGNMLGCTSFIN